MVDADALNVLAGELERLATRARGAARAHAAPGRGGAAARPRRCPPTSAGRVAAAREIARRTRAICCLKGHRTVVTDGERVYVNDTGNPGMATAGAGDVLAGILVAYLARRARTLAPRRAGRPFDAAARAVRVHGLAGDLAAARARAARGSIASDLDRFLPDGAEPQAEHSDPR